MTGSSPLDKQGGERRLNVAVTRACAESVVFCSFRPEEMKVVAEPPRGLELLRECLLTARDGTRGGGDLAARSPSSPDQHRIQITDALRDRGLSVRENIGTTITLP